MLKSNQSHTDYLEFFLSSTIVHDTAHTNIYFESDLRNRLNGQKP